MDGWKMILSFWEILFSGAKLLVSGRVHTWRYGWWFRNPAITSWRLVVYPIIYKGFIHPRWLALGFLPSTVPWYPLKGKYHQKTSSLRFDFCGGGWKVKVVRDDGVFWPEFNCDTTREDINSLSFRGGSKSGCCILTSPCTVSGCRNDITFPLNYDFWGCMRSCNSSPNKICYVWHVDVWHVCYI